MALAVEHLAGEPDFRFGDRGGGIDVEGGFEMGKRAFEHPLGAGEEAFFDVRLGGLKTRFIDRYPIEEVGGVQLERLLVEFEGGIPFLILFVKAALRDEFVARAGTGGERRGGGQQQGEDQNGDGAAQSGQNSPSRTEST